MSILTVNNISKTFHTYLRPEGKFGLLKSFIMPVKKHIHAVKNINFNINQGESVAYLGPNGAGKSTTIKMLTGILVPTSGEIRINRLIPHKERKKNSYQIGVLFGQRTQLIPELPVKDSYDLLKYMYSIPAKKYQDKIEEFSQSLEIKNLLNRPARTLSLGQRMRCEILASLLHDPEILFLDEPTIGLDVLAKEQIQQFIKKMNHERKVTILLTTHDFSDIERLCQRLIIIDKGKIIYDGSLKLIREKLATLKKMTLSLTDEKSAKEIYNILKKESLLNIEISSHLIHLSYDQNITNISTLLSKVIPAYRMEDLVVSDESIESIIKRIYANGIS